MIKKHPLFGNSRFFRSDGMYKKGEGEWKKGSQNWENLQVFYKRKEDGKFHGMYMHNIIYELFVGPIPENQRVKHINGDRTDNRVENLCLINKVIVQKPKAIEEIKKKPEPEPKKKDEKKGKARRIVCYSVNDNKKFTFGSLRVASKMTGITQQKISYAIERNKPVNRLIFKDEPKQKGKIDTWQDVAEYFSLYSL